MIIEENVDLNKFKVYKESVHVTIMINIIVAKFFVHQEGILHPQCLIVLFQNLIRAFRILKILLNHHQFFVQSGYRIFQNFILFGLGYFWLGRLLRDENFRFSALFFQNLNSHFYVVLKFFEELFDFFESLGREFIFNHVCVII